MAENRLLNSRRAFEGRIVKVDIDRVALANGHEVDLEMIRHPGAAAIVPVVDLTVDDPEVLLIKQFRHAAGGTIWEIPAGVLGESETAEDCAIRELKEETGAVAGKLEHLSTVYTTPGFTDERIHLFLASGLSMGDALPEDDEQIEVVSVRFSEVVTMIQDGTICDSKSVSGLLLARLRLRI